MVDKNAMLKLSLGPFQGITDVYFRKLFQKYFGGIDKYYTPFFTSIYKAGNRSLRTDEISAAMNDVKTLSPQILSHDAGEMMLFANECQKIGFSEINWNMGCPYPRVAKKKRGSGLMPYPEMVADILQQLKPDLPVELSIKCRLGYEQPEEIEHLLPLFEDFGLSELVVHARIGKQMYSGEVNLVAFHKVLSKSSLNLVYNGDVFSVEGFSQFQQNFPSVNHWMLGRGLLSDPFLALDIKNQCQMDTEARKQLVHQFVTDLYLLRRKNANNRPGSLGRMKELWSYLVFSFSDTRYAWRLIRKSRSFDEYEQAVASVFDQLDWEGAGFEKKRLLQKV